jgi:hypothetical protein
MTYRLVLRERGGGRENARLCNKFPEIGKFERGVERYMVGDPKCDVSNCRLVDKGVYKCIPIIHSVDMAVRP